MLAEYWFLCSGLSGVGVEEGVMVKKVVLFYFFPISYLNFSVSFFQIVCYTLALAVIYGFYIFGLWDFFCLFHLSFFIFLLLLWGIFVVRYCDNGIKCYPTLF